MDECILISVGSWPKRLRNLYVRFLLTDKFDIQIELWCKLFLDIEVFILNIKSTQSTTDKASDNLQMTLR